MTTATNDEQASRFLMKTTFGPTSESISSFPNDGSTFFDNAKQWVVNQIFTNPTSHREYYRRGANPPNKKSYDTGGVRLPCEQHSRWVRVKDDSITPTTSLKLLLERLNPPVGGVRLLTGFAGNDVVCDLEYSKGDDPIYAADFENPDEIFEYEPRLSLYENTLEYPAYHSHGSTACPSVKKNFLNEEYCQVNRAICGSVSFTSDTFTLNEDFIRNIYDVDNKYVYITTGLRTDDEPRPCVSSSTRWEKLESQDCDNGVEESDFISSKIESAAVNMGPDSLTVDINSKSDTCTNLSIGAKVESTINGEVTCWQHVHPDLYNIYDFTSWSLNHPGGSSPITNFIEVDDSVKFIFPNHHQMIRWKNNHNTFPFLGTLGDTITYEDLPTAIQSINLADALGVVSESDSVSSPEACGSAGEIANDPSMGFRFYTYINNKNEDDNQQLDQYNKIFLNSKHTVWLNVVLNSADQLRQRVAFAFSQLFVISTPNLETERKSGEKFHHYMDIFVRNAFGNFWNILKEVSFNNMMAEMLTFIGSRSFSRSQIEGNYAYPDENYAREVMQLFTFGLWELEMNGQPKLDDNGEMIPTYTQEGKYKTNQMYILAINYISFNNNFFSFL